MSPPEAALKRKIQENKVKFKGMIKQLVDEFPDAYVSDDANEVWPLGWAVFLKGFMLPEFLAKNATQHSPPMPEQVADVVKDISRYLKILERAWP
jgi:hypothetical protein